MKNLALYGEEIFFIFWGFLSHINIWRTLNPLALVSLRRRARVQCRCCLPCGTLINLHLL